MFFCCFFWNSNLFEMEYTSTLGALQRTGVCPGRWGMGRGGGRGSKSGQDWKLTQVDRMRTSPPPAANKPANTCTEAFPRYLIKHQAESEKLCQRSFFGTHSWPVNLKLMTPAVRLPPVECKQKTRVKKHKSKIRVMVDVTQFIPAALKTQWSN